MESKSDETSMPRIKIRIESLSDMVFGLALSLGSLILITNLQENVNVIFSNVLIFGFGFVIIIMTWLGYSRTIALLPVEVPSSLLLNIMLLFCVAIEPYLLYVVFAFPRPDILYYTTVGYALDIGAMFFILGALSRLVIREIREGRSPRIHPDIMLRFKRVMKLDFIIGSVFLASTLPIFWIDSPLGYVRFLFWYSAFAFFFLRRRPKADTASRENTQSRGNLSSESTGS